MVKDIGTGHLTNKLVLDVSLQIFLAELLNFNFVHHLDVRETIHKKILTSENNIQCCN